MSIYNHFTYIIVFIWREANCSIFSRIYFCLSVCNCTIDNLCRDNVARIGYNLDIMIFMNIAKDVGSTSITINSLRYAIYNDWRYPISILYIPGNSSWTTWIYIIYRFRDRSIRTLCCNMILHSCNNLYSMVCLNITKCIWTTSIWIDWLRNSIYSNRRYPISIFSTPWNRSWWTFYDFILCGCNCSVCRFCCNLIPLFYWSYTVTLIENKLSTFCIGIFEWGSINTECRPGSFFTGSDISTMSIPYCLSWRCHPFSKIDSINPRMNDHFFNVTVRCRTIKITTGKRSFHWNRLSSTGIDELNSYSGISRCICPNCWRCSDSQISIS